MHKIEFFMSMTPPTVTHQQKRVNWRTRKFYDAPEVRRARQVFANHLTRYTPDEPIAGPVALWITWCYPIKGGHLDGEPKTSRPDIDNAQKLLQDEMTRAGFWEDDAQVFFLVARKVWAETPGIYVRLEGSE